MLLLNQLSTFPDILISLVNFVSFDSDLHMYLPG